MPNLLSEQMEQIKQNWLIMIFSAVISLAISLTLLSMQYKHEDTKDLKTEVDKKATKDELKETYVYIKQQDDGIRDEIKNTKEEVRQREEISQKWMQSIDAKLNILISKK